MIYLQHLQLLLKDVYSTAATVLASLAEQFKKKTDANDGSGASDGTDTSGNDESGIENDGSGTGESGTGEVQVL